MKTETFYFVRAVGASKPLRRALSVEWVTEKAIAVEMAERLNAFEKMRSFPGPMVEAVKIEVTPLK